MILIFCPTCRVAVRLSGDAREVDYLILGSEWFPDKFPCVNARCEGKAVYAENVESVLMSTLNIHDLNPAEAFAAFNGLGLPNEHDCGPTAVEKLFAEQRVKKFNGRMVNRSNRTILDSLEFEDGTKMYFAASADGPVIFRISKPHSYAKGVGDGTNPLVSR